VGAHSRWRMHPRGGSWDLCLSGDEGGLAECPVGGAEPAAGNGAGGEGCGRRSAGASRKRHAPGRHRRQIALVLGTLGIFLAASTVRNILLRPRPRPEGTPATAAGKPEEKKPRQIVARYPNYVWSADRTRVWRWRIWPTWALVVIDHFSRAVMAVVPLEGPNAGWVVEAMETAFRRHGPPKHIITDQEGVFTSEVFGDLVWRWHVKHRFGAVGKRGSKAEGSPPTSSATPSPPTSSAPAPTSAPSRSSSDIRSWRRRRSISTRIPGPSWRRWGS